MHQWFSFWHLQSVRGFSSQPCLIKPEGTAMLELTVLNMESNMGTWGRTWVQICPDTLWISCFAIRLPSGYVKIAIDSCIWVNYNDLTVLPHWNIGESGKSSAFMAELFRLVNCINLPTLKQCPKPLLVDDFSWFTVCPLEMVFSMVMFNYQRL